MTFNENTGTEINLEPNWGRLFAGAIADARNRQPHVAEHMRSIICEALISVRRHTGEDHREMVELGTRAAVLRELQALFAGLAIALNAATAVTQVEEVRTLFADILQGLDRDASALEAQITVNSVEVE